jgi:cyclic beta-1,2-glucan synthetase
MNKDESIYYQPLYESIREEVYERRKNVLNRPGGIFIINENTLTVEDKSLLYSFANIIIDAEKGIKVKPVNYSDIPYKEFIKSKMDYPKNELELDLDYFNGYGGFAENGKKYVIKLADGVNTPMPWINVIANSSFGCIVTESGAGFTWADNSRENKLTPWYNDPILSPQGEILYLLDNETGEIWSITPKPIRDENDYIISHGMGYTAFYHNSNGIEQELTIFVPQDDRIKVNLVKLKNKSDTQRNISLYYYLRPVLGVTDEETEKLIETSISDNIFIVKNPTNTEFKGSTLFIGTSEDIRSYTGDRNEFLGTIPNYEMPEGIKRVRLSNTVGIGYNPCVALEVNISLQANEEKEIVFLLGKDKDQEAGCKLIERYKDILFTKNSLERTKQFWENLVSTIQIETPDNAMNYMMNQWLIYQTVVSRIWARTGFYQVGGAYGARDQMQDATNMIYHLPEITKAQILNNCAHQFKEGDIQHWWHPTPDSTVHKGIRSRYSDDLLWLPLGVAKYIKVTDDVDILKEEVPFIHSPILKEAEMERYEVPNITDETASVYEHCIRAIERALRFGDKGLPLMGGGDWNDGMNKVGYLGKGQSVWLGWFLAAVLKEFISVCELMEDYERAKRYEEIINQLKEAIEENAWDGEWYIRAFFDDGTPLGSKENSECMIDSIAQSWSVISGLADIQRSKMALESLEKYLINEEEGIIALLTPPFSDSDLDPGYIKSYVPGVRENGGQYTHAAIWAIKAFAMLGEGDKAYNLFKLINPINHSRTSIESAKYKVEPYVVTADVYTNPQHLGRGGWTWYTGSSGWMYIVGLEDILGFRIEKNKLIINPCIPKNWGEFSIRYRYKSTNYNIKVTNPNKVNRGVKEIYLDNNLVEGKCIKLIDDGKEHEVLVEMG